MPFSSYLIDPHLPEGEGHALLHVWPLLILLLQHVAREQWRGRHHVVLLQKKGTLLTNVTDPDPPDPHVFGPPAGSGFFYHPSIIKQK
jgi:hypothetical protein